MTHRIYTYFEKIWNTPSYSYLRIRLNTLMYFIIVFMRKYAHTWSVFRFPLYPFCLYLNSFKDFDLGAQHVLNVFLSLFQTCWHELGPIFQINGDRRSFRVTYPPEWQPKPNPTSKKTQIQIYVQVRKFLIRQYTEKIPTFLAGFLVKLAGQFSKKIQKFW